MPQENYRYFRLDVFGELHGAEWFYADSDEAAVDHVHETHPDEKCEVWQERRLVAKLGFQGSGDPVVQSLRAIDESRHLLRETAHMLKARLPTDSGGDAR